MRRGASDGPGEVGGRALRVARRTPSADLAQGPRQRPPGSQSQAKRGGEQAAPGLGEERLLAAPELEEATEQGLGGRGHVEADATMFGDPPRPMPTHAPLSLTAHVRPKPDVLMRELEGEAVLLDLASGRYFGLNSTGVRIWALLAEGGDLAAIRDRLAAEFTVAPDAIAADLLELCVALDREGLVDRVG